MNAIPMIEDCGRLQTHDGFIPNSYREEWYGIWSVWSESSSINAAQSILVSIKEDQFRG